MSHMIDKYRILIVEKIGALDYGALLSEMARKIIEEQQLHLARSVQEYLESQGHSINFKRNLGELIDDEYRNSDVALIHLSSSGIRRMKELKTRYPYVGLIMTTGDNGGNLQDLICDAEGAYILPKPFGPERLLRAIEIVKENRTD